ncbi:ATP-binding cassette domain-containing protein [Candidatus Gottesmanbacteria bacterium]|nr:ATP-binding cassette domain-containing protein [Candidatus Gottesmanbacteria bacterium]
MIAISVSHLKKYYPVYQKEPGLIGSLKSLVNRKFYDVKAVDGISFEIQKGELVGFIGPNGAGKTTTLKCLSGLLYPNGGKISVLDFNPFNRQKDFLKKISLIMGQKNQLWWDLPPMDSFLLNKEIYEIEENEFNKTLTKLTSLLKVKDLINVPVRKLSLGERMKCELIASLLHSPEVIFMDEPTIGLDVVMQKTIRDFIRDYNREYHATILLTSHYMEDVRQLCKRVIIIDHGKLIFDGLLENIVKKFAQEKLLSITFEKEVSRSELEKFGDLKKFIFPHVELAVSRKDSNNIAAKLLETYQIDDLNITEPDIEDIIRRVFAGEKDNSKV